MSYKYNSKAYRGNSPVKDKRISPQRVNLKERYIGKNSPARTTVERTSIEAKKVLDHHINYLSKGCFYFCRDQISHYDEDIISILR